MFNYSIFCSELRAQMFCASHVHYRETRKVLSFFISLFETFNGFRDVVARACLREVVAVGSLSTDRAMCLPLKSFQKAQISEFFGFVTFFELLTMSTEDD